MFHWPTSSSYPTGFLACDGSAVSRTSYADLFALIGTTYGIGDGSTTFNLPNIVAAGSGSPGMIIKASLGGTVEPSTVAHAANHIRSGSDIIDGDRVQVDYVPSYYTRNSAATGAGANTDLTAHLAGIDTKLNVPAYLTVSRDLNWTATVNNPSSYAFPSGAGLTSSFTKRSSSSILLCTIRAQLYTTSGAGGGFDFFLTLGGNSYGTYAPVPGATNSWFINNTFAWAGLAAGTYTSNVTISAWNACQLTFQAYGQPISYTIVELG
jgi:hypothetical protein